MTRTEYAHCSHDTLQLELAISRSMLVGMDMGVGVNFARGVEVAMDMDKVGPLQQGRLPQHLRGLPFCDNTARLENITVIRNILDNIQVVCGRDHGLDSPTPAH